MFSTWNYKCVGAMEGISEVGVCVVQRGVCVCVFELIMKERSFVLNVKALTQRNSSIKKPYCTNFLADDKFKFT